MSIEDNKALIRQVFKLVNKGGGAFGKVVDQYYAQDVIYHAGTLSTIHGLKNLMELFNKFSNGFPDMHVDLEHMLGEDDRVIIRWTAAGTHTGKLYGIRPTGKKGTITGMTMYRIAGGKVVEEWELYDLFGLLQQLGAIPPNGLAVFPWLFRQIFSGSVGSVDGVK